MDRYERSLYRFLFVFVGDSEVAAECTQETFVRAYDNLCRGRSVNARWLFTVGRNRAMDEFRHRHRESVAQALLRDLVVDHHAEPHQEVALREAFAQLSPDDRTVLYLAVIEGLSGEEMASLLGVKISAIRVRLFRARQRFKLMYGGAG